MNEHDFPQERRQPKVSRMPTDEGVTNHERLASIVASHNHLNRDAVKRLVLSSSDEAELFLQRKSQGGHVSEEFFDDNNISANNLSDDRSNNNQVSESNNN